MRHKMSLKSKNLQQYLLETDADNNAANNTSNNTQTNNNDNTDISDVNVLVKQVSNVQKNPETSIETFSKFAESKYSIKDHKSFTDVIKSLLKGAALIGVASMIMTQIKNVLSIAITLIAKATKILPKNIDNLIDSKFMTRCGIEAIISCFLIFVLYKVFMWILNKTNKKIKESINYKNSELYRQLQLKRSLLETQLMFYKLKQTTNHYYLTEGEAANNQIMSTVENAQPKCQSMLSKIMNAPVEFIKKYKKLIILILICIGFAFGYKGVLKIMNTTTS